MSVSDIPDAENDSAVAPDEIRDGANAESVTAESANAGRVYDERANVPVTVVAERFLRAILLKVPLDRIEELHLFSPLRQGTAETGIAVVAARVIIPDEEVPPAPALELALDESELPAESATSAQSEPAAEAVESDSPATGEATADSADDSPYSHDADNSEPPISLSEALTDAVPFPIPQVPKFQPVPRVRHTVYTARYRLVVKGPDRGRWEMDVVDEADAPLLTVETVVRGVQRRAGEDTATIRYDAPQLARALRIEFPFTLPDAPAEGI